MDTWQVQLERCGVKISVKIEEQMINKLRTINRIKIIKMLTMSWCGIHFLMYRFNSLLPFYVLLLFRFHYLLLKQGLQCCSVEFEFYRFEWFQPFLHFLPCLIVVYYRALLYFASLRFKITQFFGQCDLAFWVFNVLFNASCNVITLFLRWLSR